ncbi:hypothetical protein [Actinomadura madurae]|uniref:hypothetical protein n=1 Tax=Actinomadura madurae TaxID=1993 RepID=UPI0020D1FD68|nr:hypothetical protein [Actinomadura madurae]MCP9950893.1 hypothetical protein [Actinomadura madurae]MCP9967681.1 hypothetical protein [Actinomadura madurae]MCQ0016340.1 hypothetical protein [Actinomadura madurae]
MTVLRDEGANSGRSLVTDRRDFHKYAERAWCEVRTASLLARRLADLGYTVNIGRDVVSVDRMGLPSDEELAAEYERAITQGADPEYAPRVAGGFAGVVGILRSGRPGPSSRCASTSTPTRDWSRPTRPTGLRRSGSPR